MALMFYDPKYPCGCVLDETTLTEVLVPCMFHDVPPAPRAPAPEPPAWVDESCTCRWSGLAHMVRITCPQCLAEQARA